MKYIRIIGILILCLLLPLGMSAKRSKKRIPDKPVVADSILPEYIFSFLLSIHASLMNIKPICI